MHQPPGTTPQAQRHDEPPPLPGATAPAPAASTEEAELPRNTQRKGLPTESPGRMVLSNQQSVFVTLHDISRGGCCVVRKGELALMPEDRVRIEMWRVDIQTKTSLPATVRWVKHHNGKTRAGLRFVDTSIKTQRLIDDYLQRSFRPGA